MDLPRLHIEGTRFVDAQGRTVILRGINLGGDCKLPYPDGGTHHPSDFSDHREVSFIGRPFPLDEADEHFGRLRHWGFNCLRMLTTWEAIEHAGPGQHDEAYLDYYAELCRRAGEHGFYLFVDFHQDVFSRMSGGSGAPCWVLEAVGLDRSTFGPADAAIVMQDAYDYDDPRARQEERYPLMCWSRNYNAPANGVLWSLFFGGRDFAPQFEVEGQNIQDYLQDHYLACQRAVAERVKDLTNVLGFDTLNEPSMGFIGLGMEERRGINRAGELAIPGLSWSPLNALYALAGHRVTVPFNEVSFLKGGVFEVEQRSANPTSVRVWNRDGKDPFEAAGAWCVGPDGQPVALDPDFFTKVNGRSIQFESDYLRPFVHRVAETTRAVQPAWMVFFEKDGNTTFSDPSFPDGMPDDAVYAPHWYDLVTLMMKRFTTLGSFDAIRMRPVVGAGGIQSMYVDQIGSLQRSATWMKRSVPTLLGEFGIPYDMQQGEAYQAWAKGDHSDKPWQPQIKALDLTYNALDQLLMSSTQWNYTASNRNDARIGDGWNQEDLSVFSRDQQDNPDDPNSGGRALTGFVRPFARRIQGRPLRVAFDRRSGVFTLDYEADPTLGGPTEIFVPQLQYPDGFQVLAEDVDIEADTDRQVLKVRARRRGSLTITIRRRS